MFIMLVSIVIELIVKLFSFSPPALAGEYIYDTGVYKVEVTRVEFHIQFIISGITQCQYPMSIATDRK